MTPHESLDIATLPVLQAEIRRLRETVSRLQDENSKLRAERRQHEFAATTWKHKESFVVTALSFARDHICGYSMGGPRAMFWVERSLRELGVEPDARLNEDLSTERALMQALVADEERERRAEMVAWRDQPIAAE